VTSSDEPAPRVRNVAVAASSYAPHKGGVEELVRQLVDEQSARGGRPIVMTMRWPKDLPASEDIEGIPVRRYLYRFPEGRPSRRVLARFTAPAVVSAIAAELRSQRTELVHIQCVSSGAWFVERAARRVGLPVVATLQGELKMDATRIYERSPRLRQTLMHLMRTADAVTACSGQTLHEAEEWSGIDLGERGSVVFNGVRVSDFESGTPFVWPRPYVFAIGRMVHQKGFDVLIDAFHRLIGESRADLDLLIAGDGAERADLEARVEALGLGDHVTFLGATDRDRTVSLFLGCRLFVLPSRHEPFGIVNLEAMAAGRPIVATAVGGVPEFVSDGETGLLVEPENPVALCDAMRSIVDDADLARRLSARARLRANEFDWSAIETQYQRVYAEAIERFQRAR
jgi:glycogen(starch) synthase